jgi:hypothetical protein
VRPTLVPTYRPIDAAPAAKAVTPPPAATLAPATQATAAPMPDTAKTTPNLAGINIGIASILGVLALIVVAGIVAAVVIRRRRSAD